MKNGHFLALLMVLCVCPDDIQMIFNAHGSFIQSAINITTAFFKFTHVLLIMWNFSPF